MTISFKNQTIVRLRPGRKNERGNQIWDWDHTDNLSIYGCRIQPLSAEEIHKSGARNEGGRRRDAVERKYKIFAPVDADIHEHDRVKTDQGIFDVEGQINRYESPSGIVPHSEFTIRRIDG